MGKSTISMAIFNSYVKLPEGIPIDSPPQNGGFHQESWCGPPRCLGPSHFPPPLGWRAAVPGGSASIGASKMIHDGNGHWRLIKHVRTYGSMDWFLGENLNRKPSIFQFFIWGFPVKIFPTKPIHWMEDMDHLVLWFTMFHSYGWLTAGYHVCIARLILKHDWHSSANSWKLRPFGDDSRNPTETIMRSL